MTTGTEPPYCLVLRLAAPLQSWGGPSPINRRDTMPEPTKGGIVGLLAAAQGLRRQDPIEDLLGLSLGVRTDRPGTLLRDYHTASTLDGRPLPAAQTNPRGQQKTTSPAKNTYVTVRFYLQDAVFVAALHGPRELLLALGDALRRPGFPLALGRRCCPPTLPLLLAQDGPQHLLWPGNPHDVLRQVPRQAIVPSGTRLLPATLDDPHGDDIRADVPRTFNPQHRSYATRTVRHVWVDPPQQATPGTTADDHDPFALTY